MTTTTEPVTSDWNRDQCTSWCTDTQHNHDPACWGEQDAEHEVLLSMETGFPREAVQPYDPVWLRQEQDPPRAGVYAYRAQPGYREVVYLHLYRPSDNKFLDLDCSVHLTGREAVQLAQYLITVADEIGGAQ